MRDARGRKELSAVRKDLQTRQMQMMAETQKVMRSERRAHAAETQLAAAQSNCVRLQLDIDKLRMKYEPGTVLLRCALLLYYDNKQSGHSRGKTGKVREFKSGQETVRENRKKSGKMWSCMRSITANIALDTVYIEYCSEK